MAREMFRGFVVANRSISVAVVDVVNCSLPNIVQVDLLSEFSQLVSFLKEQGRI